MHELSTADGFVEISENLADMMKFVANEPSMGLFYVQQHTQKSVPNVINLKNKIVDKSHETALHTQDLEDSITMIGSMKECGVPIADEMIREINMSLSVISTKQPKRGLLHNNSRSGFLGGTASWSPAMWGSNPKQGVEKTNGYLSSVFKSATKKAGNFNWALKEESRGNDENLSLDTPCPNILDTPCPNILEAGAEDLPLSSQTGDEVQEESEPHKSLSNQELQSLCEYYDEFKADKESKYEEWLGGSGNEDDRGGRNSDRGALRTGLL